VTERESKLRGTRVEDKETNLTRSLSREKSLYHLHVRVQQAEWEW